MQKKDGPAVFFCYNIYSARYLLSCSVKYPSKSSAFRMIFELIKVPFCLLFLQTLKYS